MGAVEVGGGLSYARKELVGSEGFQMARAVPSSGWVAAAARDGAERRLVGARGQEVMSVRTRVV